MVLRCELQSPIHVVAARPEESVADARVIDEKAAKARLQVGVGRHFADDLVKAIVLQNHARVRRQMTLAVRNRSCVAVRSDKLLRLEVLDCQSADCGIDHRSDQEEVRSV
jgi:hypothetical protein